MSELMMKYFVLKPAGDDVYARASRSAMMAYAQAIREENADLGKKLMDWVATESSFRADGVTVSSAEILSEEQEGVLIVADVQAAITQLEISLETLKTNEAINRKEGNSAQADLEAINSKELQDAIHVLIAISRRELWRI